MHIHMPDLSAYADRPVVRVWQNPNYARFMAGIGPYYVTSWMQRVAVAWLAWQLSHSNAWVGVTAAADLGPMVLLAPFAGAIADRVDPLRQLKLMQLGMSVQALVLAATVLTGVIDNWLLLLLSLISGSLQPFYNAARQTAVPLMVPREDFASAVSLDSSFFHGSRFLGPAIAAVTIGLIGSGGTCAVHVLGCLFFFLMCSRIDTVPPDRSKRRTASLTADVVEGMSYVRGHTAFRSLFLMMMVASVVARPLQDLLPGFADEIFHAGATGLSWLTSSMGVGSLCAAVFLATRGHAKGLEAVSILSTCGLAIATFGFVATHELPYAVMFAAMFGFALTLMGVSVQVLAQVAVADKLRGRVMSLYALIYRGMPAFGNVLIGFLAEHVGLRTAFALSAATCFVLWLVVAPRAKRIGDALTHEHH